ncbi:MAG: peptidoglycan DD-metalloendopeptidase family protein [Prevotella sp.]|jgi:murein DD-endopeptidase MepM/ murein hydrolase activator NlpD
MKSVIKTYIAGLLLSVTYPAFAQQLVLFTPAEQQQISITTPGIFSGGSSFTIDFDALGADDYSFPLPVGKATVSNGQILNIETTKGDAVKAMFDGAVRMSRKSPHYGNIVIIRHDNGLETVYGNNAQNLVKVGQRVKAGQTIAIVGGDKGKYSCLFAFMVNGGWINPSIIIDPGSHRLRNAMIQCRKKGNHVDVSVVKTPSRKNSLDPDDFKEDPFAGKSKVKLNLTHIAKAHWAYPLPGSHVISPYGGRRRHSGVDIKTKPNDKILAAFDGIVTKSSPFSGYGNCIIIRHAYGFETLYSHQSKNFVRVGQKVKAGEVIGLTGRTGRATTEHLHFEVKFRGHKVNPAVLFDHGRHALKNITLTLTKAGRIK